MDIVKHYMEENLITVDSTQSVQDGVDLMNSKKIGAVLVVEKETIVGIFSETDLLRRVVASGKKPEITNISEVMSTPLKTIDAESNMISAFLKMQQFNLRHLAVTERKKVTGVLSIKDIANYYVNKFKK